MCREGGEGGAHVLLIALWAWVQACSRRRTWGRRKRTRVAGGEGAVVVALEVCVGVRLQPTRRGRPIMNETG